MISASRAGAAAGPLTHVQDLLTDVNIPYAGALASLPDVAAAPLWNVNYTDFLLRVNSSPLCPPPSFHLLLFLSETTGPGHKHQLGTGGSGRRDGAKRLRGRTEEFRTGAALLLPTEKS